MIEKATSAKQKNPWCWIPSLYFFEAIPYNIVMAISVIMYAKTGISNTSIAFWTSILYLPWVIKPVWSPVIDARFTKRKWIVITQLLTGIIVLITGFTLKMPVFFTTSLILLSITAFLSATHDIAADGFYIIGLSQHEQTWFAGIRTTFYRLAWITTTGLIVMLAGHVESITGLQPAEFTATAVEPVKHHQTDDVQIGMNIINHQGIRIFPKEATIPFYENGISEIDSAYFSVYLSKPPEHNSKVQVNISRVKGSKDIRLKSGNIIYFNSKNWNVPVKVFYAVDHNCGNEVSTTFRITSGNVRLSWMIAFIVLGILLFAFGLYHLIILPRPLEDNNDLEYGVFPVFIDVFKTFFKKKGIIGSIAFLLFYRFAESQLVKLASPFLLASRNSGGLALSTTQVGFAYGTNGIIFLTVGGILGGLVAARYGLKKWIWIMAAALNLPNLVYLYLSYFQPESIIAINSCIAIEQFGYGFGFTGYVLYQLYLVGNGKYKTAHFAITTGLMALGMMMPGMISGAIQEFLGYKHFFVYIMLCTIPAFVVLKFVNIDPEFGKKKNV